MFVKLLEWGDGWIDKWTRGYKKHETSYGDGRTHPQNYNPVFSSFLSHVTFLSKITKDRTGREQMRIRIETSDAGSQYRCGRGGRGIHTPTQFLSIQAQITLLSSGLK